jgi:Protein of unknown function (DUF2848)
MPAERNLDLAAIEHLVIAGWTGRDVAALEAHIKELEALGFVRPRRVPIFYRNAASLLTTAGTIEAVGDKSSGEGALPQTHTRGDAPSPGFHRSATLRSESDLSPHAGRGGASGRACAPVQRRVSSSGKKR